jgi:lysophospholipid acyltransferase
LWLKHYVHLRATPKGQRAGPRESGLVFMVSAFWHGFYPFYYFMFFFAAILGEVCKDIYRARYIFRNIPYPISSILAK